MNYEFEAELWEYPGQGAWHFITLPVEYSEEIKALAPVKKGFGSVRVEVTIGSSVWKTSIFPDAKSGAYFLPVKKDVRKANAIVAGDIVKTRIAVQIEDILT